MDKAIMVMVSRKFYTIFELFLSIFGTISVCLWLFFNDKFFLATGSILFAIAIISCYINKDGGKNGKDNEEKRT